MPQWEDYLTTIVGVFVIEDQIMHAYAEQFTSKVDTMEMWLEVDHWPTGLMVDCRYRTG